MLFKENDTNKIIRVKEHDLLKKWYKNDTKPVLNVFGQGGSGKTYLVREFAKQHQFCFYENIFQVKDFKMEVLNIIDNVDTKGSIEELKVKLLDADFSSCKIILISRRPLELMIDPLFRKILLPMEVNDLDFPQVCKMLPDRVSKKQKRIIYEASMGRPLLIKAFLHKKSFKCLVRQFFKEGVFIRYRPFIEASCFLWRFNREVLEDVVSSITPAVFKNLAFASYIKNDIYGFFISPAARKIVIDAIPKDKHKEYLCLIQNISKNKISKGDEPPFFWVMSYLFSQSDYFARVLGSQVLMEEKLEDKNFINIRLKQYDKVLVYITFVKVDRWQNKHKSLSPPFILIKEFDFQENYALQFYGSLIKNVVELGMNNKIVAAGYDEKLRIPLIELGFRKLADYYVLDIKSEGIENWLQRISENNKATSRLYSQEEVVSIIRNAFKNWWDYEKMGCGKLAELLLDREYQDLPHEIKGKYVKKKLEEALEQLKNEKPFLRHFIYTGLINPQLPRKQLAKIFDISERTFYRRVEEALYKVVCILFDNKSLWGY